MTNSGVLRQLGIHQHSVSLRPAAPSFSNCTLPSIIPPLIAAGGSVGCETADYLAPLINDLFPTNRDITLIEMTKGLMTGESGATKSLLTRRMMEKGVKIELNSKITYVDENTIKYEKNHQEYVVDDVDTLVFAVGYNPVASPIENAHLIGDCQKVGTLKDAITNAYQITKEI